MEQTNRALERLRRDEESKDSLAGMCRLQGIKVRRYWRRLGVGLSDAEELRDLSGDVHIVVEDLDVGYPARRVAC